MNLSLLHLSAQNYQVSPFLCARNQNFQMKSCVLINFFQTFFYSFSPYSHKNGQDFYFSSILFSKFLSTAILIDHDSLNIEKNSYSILTLNLTTPNDHLLLKDCKFLKCQSNQGIGGGLFYRYNGTSPNSLFQIQKCSFVSCSAVSSACFYACGCSINIQYICAMSNYADHIQIFDCISTSKTDGLIECQYSQFDQCSIIGNAGESTSLFINSPSIDFNTNNHTRCSVHDTACCGYFASESNLKYSLNTNVNCTGSNYIIFYARQGINQIDNSLFYMCHAFNELKLKAAIYFSGIKIMINQFHFYKTQLNTFAKPIKIMHDESINSRIYFINCDSDVSEGYLQSNANFIVMNKFIFENQKSIGLNLIDYPHWKCATDSLPVRTRSPTMSSRMIEEDNGNKDKENIKSNSNTYIEIMLYFGLTIIILITLNIQLIDYRQNSRNEVSSIDESSVLMDHTDYDANYEDESPVDYDEKQDLNYVSI